MSGESSALILFAHGARHAAWAAPFIAMRDAIAAEAPALRVRLAFLELMEPRLPAAVEALVSEGVRHITVVPAFLGPGGHLQRDLPRLISELSERHPECRIRQTRSIGEAPEVIAAVARFAASEAGG